MPLFVDLALARRLERAEGRAGAGYVEARARLHPESKSEWTEIAGATVLYDGPDSPITQTFGLGLFDPIGDAELAQIETFFSERGAPTHHDCCPLAGAGLYATLADRGYRPVEVASVQFLELRGRPPVEGVNPEIEITIASGSQLETWAAIAAEGWRGDADIPGLDELMRVAAARTDALAFLACFRGKPVAAGGLSIHDGIALMAGASTIPAARGNGAQRALYDVRLRHASELGCELAMVVTEPGSKSQRNGERGGFRIAYTRTKWSRRFGV